METTPATGAGATRRRIIKRPRLTRLLDESGARIILLVAPAGYGKTTLAHEWLDERRATWYRCSPASADVAALAVGLAETTSQIVPGAGDRLRQRLRATDRPEEDASILGEMLAEDLTEWPEDAWLVVDDYHFAMDSRASDLFASTLLTGLPSVPILITARRRPNWSTGRRRVYGEVFELGRDSLAMNDGEAHEVLAAQADVSSLVQQAAGWPAVLGLAALSGGAFSKSELSASLSDYFAQELYDAVEPGVQWGLCQLALAPAISRPLAERLFGRDTANVVLERATHIGALTLADDDESFELHPLLRPFLATRGLEFGDSKVDAVVLEMARFLIERQDWDGTFSLIKQTGSSELMADLLKAGTEEMLSTGRLATLNRWLEYSGERGVRAPAVGLARADVSFREARYHEAELLAVEAARQGLLAEDMPFVSRAFSVAGHSAHFANREERALKHYREAEKFSSSSDQLRQALWGQLLCALDLDGADAQEALARLRTIGSEDDDDQVRLATADLFVALRQGTGLDLALAEGHLAREVTNPMIRSSFLNAWVFALAFAAHYEDALAASDEQITEAKRYRLAFALPQAYLTRATVCRGLRAFDDAGAWLDKAEAAAISIGGDKSEAQIDNARCLLLLAQGRTEEAVHLVASPPREFPTEAFRGEHVACRALALAAAERTVEAKAAVEEITQSTMSVEAEVLTRCTVAAIALRESAEKEAAETKAVHAFEAAARTGNFDSFVSGYRLFPQLAEYVARIEAHRRDVSALLYQANDLSLAKALGLSAPRLKRRVRSLYSEASLSPRETDVYELLAQGLSNKEIAGSLFISEATVKVHVSRILEKLGVRTRTEAAVRALKTGEDPNGLRRASDSELRD